MDKEFDAHEEENGKNQHTVCLDKAQKDVKIFKLLCSNAFSGTKTILIYDVIRLIQFV